MDGRAHASRRCGLDCRIALENPHRLQLNGGELRMLRMLWLTAALVAASIAASPLGAAEPRQILFDNVRVFDGERLLGRRDVLVRNGRISAVRARIQARRGMIVIDGRGRTLLPGLIDSHVHIFPTAAADALRFGVTTEMDMFSMAPPAEVASWRARRASYARTAEADVWSAGMGVTPPGGHPSKMIEKMGGTMPTLAPTADARAFIASRVAEGSDYIKIFHDDGAPHGAPARLTPFPLPQLSATIAAAKQAGKRAIVHVSQREDARDAMALGADAIAHIFHDEVADEPLLALAKQKGASVITTLSVVAASSGDPAPEQLSSDEVIAPHLSPTQKEMLAAKFSKLTPEELPTALRSVAAFHKAGVWILAGTDASNPGTAHGPTLHQELQLLVRAGLSPAAALRSATAMPAAFFGLSDRGRIAIGGRADLLLVEGNPTVRIEDTRRIVGIWKNGWRVDRGNVPVRPPPSQSR